MTDFQTVPAKFRKRPVIIEAMQYLPPHNCSQVARWTGEPWDDVCDCDGSEPWLIETLEGTMEASPGDWIIKGVQNEFYPCKPDIFEATYEPVTNVTLDTPPQND